jgi:integrase
MAADLEDLRGRRCFGGLDLSTTTDVTALAWVFPPDDDDGLWHVLSRYFVPEDNLGKRAERDRVPYDLWTRQGFIEATPGNVVDYGVIEERIRADATLFDVKEIAYDPWNATYIALRLQDEGAKMIEFRQGYRSMAAPTRELYLKETGGQVRPKTRVERERHLRRDWAPLHDRPIAEIRKGEVAGRLLEIKDEHGGIAANRSRSTLVNLIEWAMGLELLEVNVVAAAKWPLKDDPERDRLLDEAERRAVWTATASGGAYESIVRLALLLGQRRGEIGGMKWQEVDLDRALWSLPAERVKNGKAHQVTLPRQAVEILEAQPRRGEHVFGDRGDAPFSGWSRCKRRLDKRCGVRGWTIHDLRRSAVTAMNDLGIARTWSKRSSTTSRARPSGGWPDATTRRCTSRSGPGRCSSGPTT